MQEPRIPLADEGIPFAGFAALATLVFALLGWSFPAVVLLCLTWFILYFFRDPVRVTPQEESAIVSPADGKIIKVAEVEDERFLKKRVRKISIFMNVFNVHVNRLPLTGTVETVRLRPGRFFAADDAKAELHNETCAISVLTPDCGRYAVVQMAGLIARRIVCRAEPGDELKTGERFGLIRFGSRVDLYLPLEAHIKAQVGDKVRAGETLLGYWHAGEQ